MTDARAFSRRAFMGGVSAAALIPTLGAAQTTPPPMPDIAAMCRELSGFDPVPRPLVSGITDLMPAQDITGLVDGTADDATRKALLKALYTGMHRPEDGAPQRFAYSSALMYAAIEDSVNVPSYCGGLPGYWAEKPADA